MNRLLVAALALLASLAAPLPPSDAAAGGPQGFFEQKLAGAQAGSAADQYDVAMLYLMGFGGRKIKTEAVRWLKEAARQGLPKAQFALGVAYVFGEGVDEDKRKAFRWFLAAAEKGHPRAQTFLAMGYKFGWAGAPGEDVSDDAEKWIAWLTKAADQGKVEAMIFLKDHYADRIGTDLDSGDFAERALLWLFEAARAGDSESMYRLALMYKLGDMNLPKDLAECEHLLKSAANNGHEVAKEMLEELMEGK